MPFSTATASYARTGVSFRVRRKRHCIEPKPLAKARAGFDADQILSFPFALHNCSSREARSATVPSDGVIPELRRTHVPNTRHPARNPRAHLQSRLTHVVQPLIQIIQRRLHLQNSFDGVNRMLGITFDRSVEEKENAVTHELVDEAAMPPNDRRHRRQIQIEQLDRVMIAFARSNKPGLKPVRSS